MKFITTTIILLSALFYSNASSAQLGGSIVRSIAKYNKAKENGKNVKSWQRYEAGYSLPVATATYFHQVSTSDNMGNVFDSSVSKKIKATSTFGAYAGTYFPVSKMGDDAILAISVGVRANIYKFSTGNLAVDSSVTDNVDFLSLDMGVPISLDYKWGCDATLDKSKRSCVTFGFGFYPTYLFTGIPTGINTDGSTSLAGKGTFAVQPFLKAEFGFMAGICFKVRAMYNFGNIKYLDLTSADQTAEQLSLTGKSNLTLSLLLMPFSWDWEKARW